MARDNVVIIIAKGTGWGSGRVSLGAFKAHSHTLSVWEKNAPKRGTAVWVVREDGDQVRGKMAYCKLHLCI